MTQRRPQPDRSGGVALDRRERGRGVGRPALRLVHVWCTPGGS